MRVRNEKTILKILNKWVLEDKEKHHQWPRQELQLLKNRTSRAGGADLASALEMEGWRRWRRYRKAWNADKWRSERNRRKSWRCKIYTSLFCSTYYKERWLLFVCILFLYLEYWYWHFTTLTSLPFLYAYFLFKTVCLGFCQSQWRKIFECIYIFYLLTFLKMLWLAWQNTWNPYRIPAYPFRKTEFVNLELDEVPI